MTTILTFSYRDQEEPRADYVVDARCLKNPYNVAKMRHMNGTHKLVQDYIRTDPEHLVLINDIIQRSKPDAVIAVGCFGGHHRSVAIAEMAAQILRDAEKPVTVKHLALEWAAHPGAVERSR